MATPKGSTALKVNRNVPGPNPSVFCFPPSVFCLRSSMLDARCSMPDKLKSESIPVLYSFFRISFSTSHFSGWSSSFQVPKLVLSVFSRRSLFSSLRRAMATNLLCDLFETAFFIWRSGPQMEE